MEDKNNYIKEVEDIVRKAKSQFINILNKVGFEKSVISRDLNQDEFKNIVKSVEDHVLKSSKSIESCQTGKDDLPSPISKMAIADERLIYTIDEETKKKLLQRTRTNESVPHAASTAGEYEVTYSTEEKNILYEFALNNTLKIQTPPELLLDDEGSAENRRDESNMTEEEQQIRIFEAMKRERDLKRRRIAYRRKVSTKDKSHTEVTREMISNVMEALFGEIPANPVDSSTREEHRQKDGYLDAKEARSQDRKQAAFHAPSEYSSDRYKDRTFDGEDRKYRKDRGERDRRSHRYEGNSSKYHRNDFRDQNKVSDDRRNCDRNNQDDRKKEYNGDNSDNRRREYEKDNIGNHRREYDRDKTNNRRREYKDNLGDRRREYDRDNSNNRRRAYDRHSTDNRKRAYDKDNTDDCKKDTSHKSHSYPDSHDYNCSYQSSNR